MADDNARFGHKGLQLLRDIVDGVDAVVEKVDLPSPRHFAIDCLSDGSLIIRQNEGFHRMPVARRGLDRAHIPRAGEREIERARDRRGGEREHIDEAEELLEFLLLLHTKALLLIDHHHAQRLEFHVLRQQPMRADDDIDRTILQPFQRIALPLRGLQPAEAIDPHRIGGVAFAQVLPVLLSEDGGRR